MAGRIAKNGRTCRPPKKAPEGALYMLPLLELLHPLPVAIPVRLIEIRHPSSIEHADAGQQPSSIASPSTIIPNRWECGFQVAAHPVLVPRKRNSCSLPPGKVIAVQHFPPNRRPCT